MLLASVHSLPTEQQWQQYEIDTIFEIFTAAGLLLNHSSEVDHSLISVTLLLFDQSVNKSRVTQALLRIDFAIKCYEFYWFLFGKA